MCWVELAENHRERNDTPKAVEAIKQAEDLLAQHPHLATWEFSIWLQKAKLQHQIGNEKNSVTFLDQAEKLAQEGWQKEEIEKFKTKILPELTTRSSLNLPKATKAEWELETILKINKMLNAKKDNASLYSLVLQLALDLSGAEDALILLYKRKKFVIEASLQAKVDVQKTCLSQTVANMVYQTQKPVQIADAMADETFSTAQSIILNQLRSILALPIFTREKITGVLYLDHRTQPDVFKNISYSLLEAFANQVGLALARKVIK